MPETPDWSAAPQAVVTPVSGAFITAEAGTTVAVAAPAAGRRYVIVGIDLSPVIPPLGNRELRGIVTAELFDTVTTLDLGFAAISPETPFAQFRPPFGSVRGAINSDLTFRLGTQPGTGAADVWLVLYSYFE